MKIKRRSFLKSSIAASAAAMAPGFLQPVLSQAETNRLPAGEGESALPWKREIPLREAAKSVTLEAVLHPSDPRPNHGGEPYNGPSMTINSLKMRTTMWGPPDRVTVSINKNNVWDRRLHLFAPPTLKEMTEGAFAPVNQNYSGIESNSLRPKDLGWLWKSGGSHDPYREPMRYAFPCLKPVGQIILRADDFAGAAAPNVAQSCSNSVTRLSLMKGGASASLEYVLGMTSDVYAIRGEFSGLRSPAALRLYRHRDTGHLPYMTQDGKQYTRPEAEADKAFNGPIDPPTSGTDGRYFWIRQRMPAEKTFPQGFEYVLMGTVAAPASPQFEAVEGKVGLGTPPANSAMPWDWYGAPRPSIAEASGAAATATLAPRGSGHVEAFVTVVTTMDGSDILAIAKTRLDSAVRSGFAGVVEENTRWWNAFYDRRESGRVFYGSSGGACTEDIRGIYRSNTDFHGGGTKTDMSRLECSASSALPEADFQWWDSAPCYNEIFTTSRFVRNWGDTQEMWKEILWHWLPGAKQNARQMFDLPGMLVSHGYLPPVKPDVYVHTAITLELCLGTMAQIVRPVWDEWDYGGDDRVLRDQAYPLLKEMALFYAGYAKKEEDGYYHIVPCMQEESWGISPKFARNKDVISSLCMFRWGLNRAAEAAEILGVDADLRSHWREVAKQIAPYPTWKRSDGLVFAEMPDLEPTRLPADHFGDAASYPALLADEINLDSPREQREMMVRSVRSLPSGSTAPTLLLMGVPPEPSNRRRTQGDDAEALLNSRSGRMHLFPAAPDSSEIAFRKFQARGGFLISACRNAGGVFHLEVEARRDVPCRMMNPWPGKKVVVRENGMSETVPVEIDTSNGECLIFAARAGHAYRIAPAREA